MDEKNVVTTDSTEEMVYYSDKAPILTRKVCVFFLLVALVMAGLTAYQLYKTDKVKEEHAYVSAALISLQEEHLMLKYGVFPADVGLGALRDAWIDNPCYETTIAYCDGLTRVIEALEDADNPYKQNLQLNCVTV